MGPGGLVSPGLAISVASAHPGRDPRRAVADVIGRVRAARDAGLDSLTVGDHHATAIPYLQNTPLLGRLLAEWGDDRPAGCLFLLPLWHPVLMAEHVGTLAAMAGEPFIVQTGIGGGEDQFAAMGADLSTRGRTSDAVLDVVEALLAGDAVDDDRFGIAGARIDPRPPGPVEWWIGAASRAGLDRAARRGAAWYADPSLTPRRAAELFAEWTAACERHGRAPGRAVLRRDVVVTADGDRARRAGDDLVAAGYRGFDPDAPVYGSAARVAEVFASYADIGFTDIVVRTMSVPPELAVETIENMAAVRAELGG